ncbi:MAG: alpha/beta fold hydrolase [Actinomycetota bacterium]|nr:alpha/beta fold hydrolase [Actinomycetota bacterium]
MRARFPDEDGFVERDGVKVFYEVYGDGSPTVFLLPTWSIVHSRFWKMQIPYLSRHFRVLTFDGRGNGKSDRPLDPSAYAEREFVADALAVMDETKTPDATIVSLSLGSQRGLMLAADHPDRVSGAVFIGASLPVTPPPAERLIFDFDEPLATDEGWAKVNRHYWLKDYRGFLEFFFSKCFTEPHSTKPIEDCLGWGLETTPEVLISTSVAEGFADREAVLAACERVLCPVLVIHGDEDAISPPERGAELAQATGGTLVTLEGAGHIPLVRDPVKVNSLLRDFIAPRRPAPKWQRGRARSKRALFISSPIGLGHAQRDVAIAKALREQVPDLQIDWLAQNPVTRVLAAEGESLHPASRFLANESQHMESESAEHDLHCFQAWRRMDEILLSNYMVFHDLVAEEEYDLWIGDEAWELDYYLHENPEQKRAAYAWLTDFVGWLPMPDGGGRERYLTKDYNAEMIEHIARYPRIRDRAIFVGNPDDIVPEDFGQDLPNIREWTEDHYSFSGYITGFDQAAFAETDAVRAELGYGSDEKICIVTVGGSGVGEHLLRRVASSFELAQRDVSGLRMILVAGPRIDPDSLPQAPGLEVRSYVHNLYRHLAVCDLAIVQGGLTTSMELTANQRPFLYFPLKYHFEQNFHVRHRLDRYRAGRCMDFDTATPEVIAKAIAEEVGREVAYRPVETDGARQAALSIAELI